MDIYNIIGDLESFPIETPASHLLVTKELYEKILKGFKLNPTVTVINFYGLKTIFTETPISKPRVLYISNS